jgi:hypothetical protein
MLQLKQPRNQPLPIDPDARARPAIARDEKSSHVGLAEA